MSGFGLGLWSLDVWLLMFGYVQFHSQRLAILKHPSPCPEGAKLTQELGLLRVWGTPDVPQVIS